MAAPARPSLDELRATLETRFRGAMVRPLRPVTPTTHDDARTDARTSHADALVTGYASLDAILPRGGLLPGDLACVRAEAGAGTASVLAGFARNACLAAEPVLVLDASPLAAPHPFVEPPAAVAPIVLALPSPADAYAALDIALRSGAFGLVIAMGLPPPTTELGPRLRNHARERACRVLFGGAPPLSPSFTVELRVASVEWTDGPLGSVVRRRVVEARVGGRTTTFALDRDDGGRLDPRPDAADRRAPHGGHGRARDRAGRRG